MNIIGTIDNKMGANMCLVNSDFDDITVIVCVNNTSITLTLKCAGEHIQGFSGFEFCSLLQNEKPLNPALAARTINLWLVDNTKDYSLKRV